MTGLATVTRGLRQSKLSVVFPVSVSASWASLCEVPYHTVRFVWSGPLSLSDLYRQINQLLGICSRYRQDTPCSKPGLSRGQKQQQRSPCSVTGSDGNNSHSCRTATGRKLSERRRALVNIVVTVSRAPSASGDKMIIQTQTDFQRKQETTGMRKLLQRCRTGLLIIANIINFHVFLLFLQEMFVNVKMLTCKNPPVRLRVGSGLGLRV